MPTEQEIREYKAERIAAIEVSLEKVRPRDAAPGNLSMYEHLCQLKEEYETTDRAEQELIFAKENNDVMDSITAMFQRPEEENGD